MGTRHLIAVQIDGEYKIAQYGQWDGYPSGQGVDILSFLEGSNLDVFKEKLRGCSWATEADLQALDEGTWMRSHPWLSRDAGADILGYVLSSENGLKLKNNIAFAGDGLFCEYAYVIDFDKGTFEIFEGFKKLPTPEDSRFPSGAEWLEKADEYSPVHLVQTYELGCLPSKDGFLSDLEGEDEDLEAAE